MSRLVGLFLKKSAAKVISQHLTWSANIISVREGTWRRKDLVFLRSLNELTNNSAEAIFREKTKLDVGEEILVFFWIQPMRVQSIPAFWRKPAPYTASISVCEYRLSC